MSNENKRINLKQFEGMTEGPWDMHYDDSALEDQEYLEHGAQLTPVGTLNEMARVDAHAIGKVPELIAELKRCYEEIDDLKRQYRSCNQSLIDTTEWNVRMQNAVDSGKMSQIKRVRHS
jgi:hypothetical protein